MNGKQAAARGQASPPARSGSASGDPIQWLTSFVGRKDEVRRLRELLDISRVVTIVGQGGMGKTRLAMHLAKEMSDKKDVHLVRLASLRDPDLVQSVAVSSILHTSPATDSSLDPLLEALDAASALLVIDNCEHVLDAIAEFVEEIATRTEHVSILCTSRQPLGIQGERIINLQPLSVPPGDAIEPGTEDNYSALALFADRVAAVLPTFKLDESNLPAVISICRQLDGMPLAIELAAVRLKVLSVTEVDERLGDRFALLTKGNRGLAERHQTLLATMDWSFTLCSPQEQELWARLAVFSGGFTLRAAQTVAPHLSSESALEVLTGLVEKSVILREDKDDTVRFRMLETVRQYGVGIAKLAGIEDEARNLHRGYNLDLLESAGREWFGPDQARWTRILWTEYPNIRSALDHAYTSDDAGREAARLTGRNGWFLWICIFLPDAQHWLNHAITALQSNEIDSGYVTASRGYVDAVTGRPGAAVEHARVAAHIAKSNSCQRLAAYATHVEGLAGLFLENPIAAAELLQSAVDQYGEHPADIGLSISARQQLALALIMSGQIDQARQQLETSEAAGQANGAQWEYSYALYSRGLADFVEGDVASALKLAARSLEIKLEFHDALGLAMTLDLAGWSLAEVGRFDTSATLLGRAERLWSTFGRQLFSSPWWAERRDTARATCIDAIGEGKFDSLRAAGSLLPLSEVVEVVLKEPKPVLSKRELEVARLIASGKTTKEMAAHMSISPRTVEAHIDHIFAKLDIRSRSQIAAWITATDASHG